MTDTRTPEQAWAREQGWEPNDSCPNPKCGCWINGDGSDVVIPYGDVWTHNGAEYATLRAAISAADVPTPTEEAER